MTDADLEQLIAAALRRYDAAVVQLDPARQPAAEQRAAFEARLRAQLPAFYQYAAEQRAAFEATRQSIDVVVTNRD